MVKKLKELSFFEHLLENPRNELVEKALEQGRTAIGINCTLVPEPLLSAGNVFPIWMTAPNIESTPQASYYLSTVVCSYVKSLLEAGLEGAYDFCGAMVFAPSCDHVRRGGQLFDLCKVNNENDNFFIYQIDAPGKEHRVTNPWFARDMRKLADKLNETYNANINDETVKKAIIEFNEFNKLIKSIGDMRKEENPKLTGTEWHIIYGACKVAPKDLLIEPLKKIKAEIEAREIEKNNNLRVMIVGSTIDRPAFTELIEAQGAIVVADRYCFGSLPGMELIEEEGDPFLNLANYYLRMCECPRMMEKGTERVNYSKDLAKEYHADGIILTQMTFCDLWGYEGVRFVEEMKKANIPIVSIAREYSLTGEGQFRTRVQAFLESIQSKREQEALNK